MTRATDLDAISSFAEDAIQVYELWDRYAGDRHLEPLRALRDVRWLRARDSRVGDAGLEIVASLPKLVHLDLTNTRVSGAGLDSLRGHSNLRVLRLERTRVEPSAIASLLRTLPHLVHVSLRGVPIDAEVMSALGTLRELRLLDLSATGLEDALVGELRELSSLRGIMLIRNPLTERGIADLPYAPHLNALVDRELSRERIRALRPDLILDGIRIDLDGEFGDGEHEARALPTPRPAQVVPPGAAERAPREPEAFIAYFGEDGCPPCRPAARHLPELARLAAGRARVYRVDTARDHGLREAYGIMSIPALVVVIGGRERLRFGAGPPADQLWEKIAPLLPA